MSTVTISVNRCVKHLCLVFIVLAIISYSVPFYRPTTLQHASPLGSRTFLTEFISGRSFLLTVDVFSAFFIFGWTVISVGFFSYIPLYIYNSISLSPPA